MGFYDRDFGDFFYEIIMKFKPEPQPCVII